MNIWMNIKWIETDDYNINIISYLRFEKQKFKAYTGVTNI